MNPDERFDILGIGCAFIDDVVRVAHYPPPDQKVPMLDESRQLGGLAATALAAAARLGARCAFAGVMGEDQLSVAMLDGFARAGVDTSFVLRRAGATPGHSVIINDVAAHTRSIFYNSAHFTPLPAEAIDDRLIRSCRVLLVDNFSAAAVFAAAQRASHAGVPIVADMEWEQCPHRDELIALVDHLIVPLHFAAAVTGQAVPADAVGALRHLRADKAATVVTGGADGCWYAAGRGAIRHCPAFAIEPVETLGCGDVFHGAYAAALAGGSDVDGCIHTASAAAAVYAARPSGWQHLATAEDVRTLVTRAQPR